VVISFIHLSASCVQPDPEQKPQPDVVVVVVVVVVVEVGEGVVVVVVVDVLVDVVVLVVVDVVVVVVVQKSLTGFWHIYAFDWLQTTLSHSPELDTSIFPQSWFTVVLGLLVLQLSTVR